MFLVNSRQAIFSCDPHTEMCRQTLSRSYGRYFAEFLGKLSPVRLGLLDPPTCVGFGTDTTVLKLRSFSWKALRTSRLTEVKLPVIARVLMHPGFS